MGYSFSIIHALAYSFVGMQTLYLATHFNPVYWNTAYLIVNSGAIDEEAGEQTDYTKIAKAIGEIRNKGIKVSLVDINRSDFGFKPDAENNQIMFGLKGLSNVNNDLIKDIINNRPFVSIVDFMNKVNANRQAMISLIKGGAFDQFCPRMEAMIQYLWITCDKKKRLTLQNMPALIRYDIIPSGYEYDTAKRVFEFNRYLKAECKWDSEIYSLTDRAIDFLNDIDCNNLINFYPEGSFLVVKEWNKVYQSYMDTFRHWIAESKDQILNDLNTIIFMEDWEKYAKGNISSWEMEALCFYYHDHELLHIDNLRYGFSDFFKLPEEPVVEKIFKRGNSNIPIYKLNKICGTCIAKNKTKSVVYVLTTTGVVPVKFRQEYFALFDKQTFQRNEDGTRKVIEKSWFNRGQMIVVQGMRRGDEFVAKKYASSNGHQLYKIDQVNKDGTLILRSERKQGEETDDNEET